MDYCSENTAIGAYSGYNLGEAESNVFVGTNSGYSSFSGVNNVFLGYGSGRNNITGEGNVFLGHLAGSNEMGSNKLYIDNSSTSDPLIEGDFSANELTINGNLTADSFYGEYYGDGSNLTGIGGNTYWTATGNDIFNNNTGNVGIGDINPDEKLSIRGNIELSGEGYDAYLKLVSYDLLDGTPAFIWSENAVGLAFGHVAGTPQVIIDENTGDVGVGLSDPNRKLYVRHTADSLTYPLKIENKHTVTNEAAVGILFSTGGSGTNERGKGGLVYEYTSSWNRGDFHFLQDKNIGYYNPDLNDAVFTIKNNGDVGIGITTPGSELEVDGTVTATAFIGDGSGLTGVGGISNWSVAGDDIYNNNSGNVGIGTTSPYATLQVNGTMRMGSGTRDYEFLEVDPSFPDGWSSLINYGGIGIGSNSGNNRQIVMFTDGSGSNNIFTVATSEDNGASWQTDFRIQQNGNVGIGKGLGTANVRLDVNGDVEIAGELDMKQNQAKNFVIENRTSDPPSPVVGQIWLRTDL